VFYKLAASLQSINIKVLIKITFRGTAFLMLLAGLTILYEFQSPLTVHKHRQRPLLLVFDRPDSTTPSRLTHLQQLSVPVELLKLRPKMSALCLILLFTHVLVITAYVTWSQRWQHDCPQLYHFQRLTYNFEFRDCVSIFIPKFRLRWTFQLLSNLDHV
jgi:hypothetical protein